MAQYLQQMNKSDAFFEIGIRVALPALVECNPIKSHQRGSISTQGWFLPLRLSMVKSSTIIATAAASFLGIVAYAVYFDRKRRRDPRFRKTLQRREERSVESNAVQPSKPVSNAVAPLVSTTDDAMNAKISRKDVDLDVDQIMAKSLEERQRVFQDLLIFGETLITVGTKATIAKGVDYLFKALNLVPNPSELLVLFQKTLAPSTFEMIIQRIDSESRTKISGYYETLTQGQSGRIHFLQDPLLSKGDVAIQNSYALAAATSFTAGDIVIEEQMDKFFVAVPAFSHSHDKHCGYCCCILDHCSNQSEDTTRVQCACPTCGLTFCSEHCLHRALDEHHKYLCNSDCQKLQGFALFMAKYLALMLSEELKGNNSLRQGPFIHYEFMQKMTSKPSPKDIEEVALLRTIFTPINIGMNEFLSDERYAAMKSTLMLNAFLISPENSVCKPVKSLDTRGSENHVYCLFNLSCHLIEKAGGSNQSLSPNVVVAINLSEQKLTASATRSIHSNEFLKM